MRYKSARRIFVMLWNQTVAGIFEVYYISPVAIFNAMRIAYYLLLGLDRLIKK